jgi:hypothetical protein
MSFSGAERATEIMDKDSLPQQPVSPTSRNGPNGNNPDVSPVVEVSVGNGVIRIDRATLRISWPGSEFSDIVDAEEFLKGMKQALTTAGNLLFERVQRNKRR